MDRERYADPAPPTRTPEVAPVPAPARAGGAAAERLLRYQASGGNQMVLRLLAAARAEAGAPPGGEPAGPSTADRIRTRLGGGRPLPADVRAEAEAGLGQPLGDVRLHTDAPAATLATDLRAHAFTTGNDIFFNHGVYDPGSTSGYRVLVHELTHTLQQASGPVAGRVSAAGLAVSDVHDADERQAYAIADRVSARRAAGPGPDRAGPDPAGPDRAAPAPGAAGPARIVQRVAVRGRRGPNLTVQRHSSWEHTLLGDTAPDRLGDATVTAQARGHLLSELWGRMMFFSADPTRDPRERFPDIRWVQLSGSGLWVSVGELNALADYLPDPTTVDTLPREDMIPVLQKMRSGIRSVTGAEFGLRGEDMHGMASHWMEFVSSAGGEVKALDEATADLGTNRYAGLLARNACHFAPFSWHRWEQYHNEATEEARLHFESRTDTAPLRDFPRTAEEHARQALLKNGYGDHFLQDSFAAGHLINKTLVMQWWVDYLNQAATTIPFTDLQIVRRGQPDADVMHRMGSAAQPGIAGRELYDQSAGDGGPATNRDDRLFGTRVIDPQTAQERTDRERRMSGSGVTGVDAADREANYQAYLRLLNNAQAQGASGAVHDHFNALGLTMGSANGARLRVGGDETLISQSGPRGAEMAAEAARLSRQAIDDLMDTGQTTITTDVILSYVPTTVYVDGQSEPIPLEQWQDSVLRDLCFNTIFPAYYSTLTSAIIGAFGETMVEGGMSQDAGRPPPAPPVRGDFPAPDPAGTRTG